MSMSYVYDSERPMPRLIALEEAFWVDDLQTSGSFANVNATMRRDRLEDLGRRLSDFTEYRLPEMDRAGVDVQVLSLTSPGIQMQSDVEIAKSYARKANDQLLKVIAEHPTRFAGFAALPLQDVPAAIEELRRTVGLGLCGALVNDHTLGHYLDEPQFDPFWMALEGLDVPLYIHPSAALIDWGIVKDHPELVGPTWSWAAATGGHVMRLVYGGVFDRHPNARVILGHMGEFLPFQLSRFDIRHADLDLQKPIARLPSHYFQSGNIMLTTTGVLSHSALIAGIQAVGIDNVMFSVDYPYESSEKTAEFIRTAPLAPHDLERVAHGNAEPVLKLNP